MKAVITHPRKCPYYTPGSYAMGLCGSSRPNAPLYCDFTPSAIAGDGFPKICPLRQEECNR